MIERYMPIDWDLYRICGASYDQFLPLAATAHAVRALSGHLDTSVTFLKMLICQHQYFPQPQNIAASAFHVVS
jgi:hypothetical protein